MSENNLGVDAYYYLTTDLNPSLQELINDWTPIVARIYFL
jgi:hypothetical protein